MALSLHPIIPAGSPSDPSHYSRRKQPRARYMNPVSWDFFTAATGKKPGFVEDFSESGCLLRTRSVIEHRRWIRILANEPRSGFWFTAIGRVIRREDRIEPWNEEELTLYRCGVEFVQPLNPLILARMQEAGLTCSFCGSVDARIYEGDASKQTLCLLCHLRRACQGLLSS